MPDQTDENRAELSPVRKPNRAERRAMIYGNAALGFPSGREPRSTTRAKRITLRQNQDAPAKIARRARAARVKARRIAGALERAEQAS